MYDIKTYDKVLSLLVTLTGLKEIHPFLKSPQAAQIATTLAIIVSTFIALQLLCAFIPAAFSSLTLLCKTASTLLLYCSPAVSLYIYAKSHPKEFNNDAAKLYFKATILCCLTAITGHCFGPLVISICRIASSRLAFALTSLLIVDFMHTNISPSYLKEKVAPEARNYAKAFQSLPKHLDSSAQGIVDFLSETSQKTTGF